MKIISLKNIIYFLQFDQGSFTLGELKISTTTKVLKMTLIRNNFKLFVRKNIYVLFYGNICSC